MKFEPPRCDIENICRLFSIGKLQDYEIEKGITFPHANSFVLAFTTLGQYALKFYPANATKTVAIEYAINRLLAHHHFPTPVMHANLNGRPFVPSNDRLATCYSYIEGPSVWNHIKEKHTIHQINATMLSLKNILSSHKKKIPFQKQENLAKTFKTLRQLSQRTTSLDQKRTINASLLNACQIYQQDQPLFTRQWLHNDANLTNFIIYKKRIHMLDLEHIKEDYISSDLASLIVSCILSIPLTTIKTIIKDYLTQHQMKPKHFPVFNTLVKIRLIQEFHNSHLPKRKASIITLLKKMNDTPRLIV